MKNKKKSNKKKINEKTNHESVFDELEEEIEQVEEITELDGDYSEDTLEKNDEKKDKVLELKSTFVERYKSLLGEQEYKCFFDSSSTYIRKTIRVNTIKISINELKLRMQKDWILTQVPWCKEGFWIEYRHGKRYDIGNTPEHQLGYIYVQDAASMIPPVVLEPEENDIILDICAAPGSKSSQIAQYMKNTGLLIANDAQGKRISALGLNLQRCGLHNTIITKMEGDRIRKFENFFDKILVDAPCSGTGTIRRNYRIAEMWSPGLVERMSKIQFKLLSNAFRMLKPGGIVVYSTCTMEPDEDEGIVDKLLKQNQDADLLDINLNIKRSKAVIQFENETYDSRVKKCLRIYPQDNDTEGFFVAKITKKEHKEDA